MSRFDLEQDIMECWGITADLQSVIWSKFDSAEHMTDDDLLNVLQGIQALYDIKFKKLFNTFEVMETDERSNIRKESINT